MLRTYHRERVDTHRNAEKGLLIRTEELIQDRACLCGACVGRYVLGGEVSVHRITDRHGCGEFGERDRNKVSLLRAEHGMVVFEMIDRAAHGVSGAQYFPVAWRP